MSTTQATKPRNFNPNGHPPLAPSYSHINEIPVSSTKKLVSIAGQTGFSPEDESIPLPEQVRIALQNVDKCLSSAGLTKRDIVSVRQYVVGLSSTANDEKKARGEIYMKWWQETEGYSLPPPSTLLGVEGLYCEGCLYEIEVTCVGSV